MNIKYKITFYSDWHCGSGLSSGADMDLLVIKDRDKLPFVPGKTIKGLLREAVEEINELSSAGFGKEIEKVFGPNNLTETAKQVSASGSEEQINQTNASSSEEQINQANTSDSTTKTEQGRCFFTNASIEKSLGQAIKDAKLQSYLFRTIAATALDENGVAKEHSLRKIEATIPCELEGEILDVPEDYVRDTDSKEVKMGEILKNGLKFIKRLGQNRNRGLGRCSFEIIPNKKEAINENN